MIYTKSRGRILFFTLLSLCTLNPLVSTASDNNNLDAISKAGHRSEKNIARNIYRHPVETLTFFSIKPNMTVVEISPGGGWYTEILAAYLKDKGQYIAAGYNPDSKSKYFSGNAKKFADKLKANPETYGKTKLTVMEYPDHMVVAPNGSADMVLTFRNVHNWAARNYEDAVFKAMFDALKPGGIMGLVEHRAGDKFPQDTSGKKGYMKQADVIKMAQKAGFKLVAQSEINANPKDTKNYEMGVWTLPPVLRLKDKDRAKYVAIGESDRMTLKFVKPN